MPESTEENSKSHNSRPSLQKSNPEYFEKKPGIIITKPQRSVPTSEINVLNLQFTQKQQYVWRPRSSSKVFTGLSCDINDCYLYRPQFTDESCNKACYFISNTKKQHT